jgi:RimJ/RimL family protein N-acetyltransferase
MKGAMTDTTLRTERLVLRRARAEDLDALHAILSDPQAMRYWSTPPHVDIEETRAWLAATIAAGAAAQSDEFFITLEGRLIGKAGCWRIPDIGYILHPDHWGKGYAAEALRAVIDHLFAQRRLPRLTADVDPRNARSVRLLRRLGFRQTGRAERTFCVGGEWSDSVYFALTPEDLPPRPALL